MPCYVPFDNKSFDLSFSVLRPTGGVADELLTAMKCFSYHAEGLGCAHSSVLKSIHGNLMIWYGAWMKRSREDRKTLNATLLSSLLRISDMAVLLQHGFFEPYAGRFGKFMDHSNSTANRPSAAKFSSGDTILMCGIVPTSEDPSDLSYACLALLQSCFLNSEGISSAVCLRQHDQFGDVEKPMVAVFQVWKSLEGCYAWLLNSDYRSTILPYISHLSTDAQFDVYKAVYVSTDDVLDVSMSSNSS